MPPRFNPDHPARQVPRLAGDLLRIEDDTRPDRGALSPLRIQQLVMDALYRGYQAGRTDAIMELMTTQDMADALGVNQQRVRALAQQRGIGWLVGRDRLFRPEDIEALRPGSPGRPRRDGA